MTVNILDFKDWTTLRRGLASKVAHMGAAGQPPEAPWMIVCPESVQQAGVWATMRRDGLLGDRNLFGVAGGVALAPQACIYRYGDSSKLGQMYAAAAFLFVERRQLALAQEDRWFRSKMNQGQIILFDEVDRDVSLCEPHEISGTCSIFSRAVQILNRSGIKRVQVAGYTPTTDDWRVSLFLECPLILFPGGPTS